MPYAITHILVAVILIELFREYFIKDYKKFPRYYILIAAIGAILPDIDIVFYYLLYFFGFTLEQIHRTFFHTLFIPLIFLLAGIFVFKIKIKNPQLEKRHMHLSTILFIFAAGSLLHLILDGLVGKVIPLYPLSNFSINLDILSLFPESWKDLILPTIDALLLFFWIFWMEFVLKRRNYF